MEAGTSERSELETIFLLLSVDSAPPPPPPLISYTGSRLPPRGGSGLRHSTHIASSFSHKHHLM